MDANLLKRLDKAILKCMRYYRQGNENSLQYAKNLLQKKKLVLADNYVIKDYTIEMVMTYGGCIPFNYIPTMKNPQKLLSRIHKGLKNLPFHIKKEKLQMGICEKCPLNHKFECFNCWLNFEIMDKICNGILEYKEKIKEIT